MEVLFRIEIFDFQFAFLFLFGLLCLEKIKNDGSSMKNMNPINKIYYLFNELDYNYESINDNCMIKGIIRYHLDHPCHNENCFINQNKSIFYGSKKNSYCFVNKLNPDKTSFV